MGVLILNLLLFFMIIAKLCFLELLRIFRFIADDDGGLLNGRIFIIIVILLFFIARIIKYKMSNSIHRSRYTKFF